VRDIASVRPARFFRTTSFRLTLLNLVITGPSFLLLFGLIYWSCTAYVEQDVDGTVSGAVASLTAETAGLGPDESIARIEALIGRSPGLFFLLEDGAGNLRAGNLPAMKPRIGTFQLRRPLSGPGDRAKEVRGQGILLGNGDYLFVGLNVYQLHEMQEVIDRGFGWGVGVTMLMAVIGGVLLSMRVLRRVESVSRVSREIVAGNLQRRLKLDGSDDEFDHLADSLNAMLDRIQQLMDGMRQVSTDIAHDLRTPLSRLRQRAELALRKASEPAALRAALDSTIREIDGVLETFGALLRIAQIEAGARKAGFTRVDLTDVLDTVVELYLSFAEERGQALAVAIAPALAVEGDRELLLQLFANLVENAIRHSPAGARIRLVAVGAEDGIAVTVADDGPGIPETMRERVFQRFVRLDASRTTPGNGLGLSLAAAVAALHGARITLADNAPGLAVTVRLAASRPGVPDLASAVAA
jgi:signal transduction histidine kinase